MFTIPYSYRPAISEHFQLITSNTTSVNEKLSNIIDFSNGVIFSLPRVTNKRANLPFFYSSSSVHLYNKLCTAERNSYSESSVTALRAALNVSIEHHKCSLFHYSATWSSKDAFSFLRSMKSPLALPETMFLGLEGVSNDIHKANLFNKLFSRVFSSKSTITIPDAIVNPVFVLSNTAISSETVSQYLLRLTAGNRAHLSIPLKFVRAFHKEFAIVLADLYGHIIQSRCFPDDWKVSVIQPTHKKGSKSDISNYRPVAMLPAFSLVFEKIIFNDIYPLLSQKLNFHQFGFQKGKSTVSQLVICLREVYQMLDSSQFPVAVYFDIAKCFDSLNHQLILNKLAAFGFDQGYLDLFHSYLTNRWQYLRINDAVSVPAEVTSGGPQGFVFLIFMFLVYIDDLPAHVNSSVYLFADDTKLLNSYSNLSVLQSDVNAVLSWGDANLIRFNKEKLEMMIFFLSRNCPAISVHIDDSFCLSQSSSVIRDLGVYISPNLKWHYHISFKLSRANAAFFNLKHSLPASAPIRVRRNLFISCVMSILLYASPSWYPSVLDLCCLERFLRRAVKWITRYSWHGDDAYVHALKHSKLLPISYRLVYNDLCLFNSLLQFQSVAVANCIRYRHNEFHTRVTSFDLFEIPKTRTVCASNEFFARSARYANVLFRRHQLDVHLPPSQFKPKLLEILYDKFSDFNYNSPTVSVL